MSQYRKYKAPVIYMLIGVSWAIFSDITQEKILKDPEIISILQITFVLLTSLFLLLLPGNEHPHLRERGQMRKRITQLENENRGLREKLHLVQAAAGKVHAARPVS